jgi:hypothetical protein
VALRLFREADKPPAAAAASAKAVDDSPTPQPARGAHGKRAGCCGGRGGKSDAAAAPLPRWQARLLRALAVVEPREASDFASVGTSAGVAVAFNAPVAGVAYAVEEGNTVYSVAMLWKVGGRAWGWGGGFGGGGGFATKAGLSWRFDWGQVLMVGPRASSTPARAFPPPPPAPQAVFSAVSAIWAMGLLSVAVKHGRRLWSAQVTLTNNLSFRNTDQISSIFWCAAAAGGRGLAREWGGGAAALPDPSSG